jgi:hypothetical protein
MASASAVSVVLVHGGFVECGGWEGLYKLLRKYGYTVSVVQNPTLSLACDVAATKLVLDAQAPPRHPRGPLLRRRGDHRGWDRSQGGRARLHRRVRAGLGRVRRVAHQGSAARCPRAAYSASAKRVSVSRQGEVPRVLRGGRGRGPRGVSSRRAGPLGSGRRSAARSPRPRGKPSRAGTWSPARTA